MTASRLVLVRHGQTSSNTRMALDSLPPGPPLTQEGHAQAAELAVAMAAEQVVAVYASTAVRAQQTAAPLAARHGLEVQVVDGVHEVFVGALEGNTDKDSWRAFVDVYGAWSEGDLSVPMPGGETGRQVLDRYLGTLAEIAGRHPDGVIVLVSHGAAMRLAGLTLAGNVTPELARGGLVPNTGRVVLEADAQASTGWRCLEWCGVAFA